MLAGRAVKLHSLVEKAKAATGMRRRNFTQPVVIGVSGGVGSGRFTFCSTLIRFLGEDNVLFLPQDIFASYTEELTRGYSLFMPEFDWESRKRSPGWRVVLPHPIVIAMGVELIAEPALASMIDHKIFVDTPSGTRLERNRDRLVFDSESELAMLTEEEETRLVPVRGKADVVVSGESSVDQAAIEVSARVFEDLFSRRKHR